MYVVLCYDVNIKRNAKVKKTVRKYLRPVQRSVCEGFITESKLKKLCASLGNLIDPDEDSVVIYKQPSNASFEKMGIGQTVRNDENIL